ncbi:MAG: HAD-IIB family hydrolase [Candidatus Dormibacteraeota bacterium]|nr:HAD-IIB family hydrolase [Candidatus Dormibacteraeota bacterium]
MNPVDIRDSSAARPRFEPRALVIDLDGTCISRGKFLHPRTAHSVRLAAQRLPVIVATGRQYGSALPWLRELGVSEPLVCYEGAMVRALPDGQGTGAVLLDEPLSAEPALRTLHVARANDWHCHAYENDRIVTERDRPELRLYTDVAGTDFTLVRDLAAVMAQGTPKVVCVIEDPAEVRRCIRLLRKELGGSALVTQSREQYVEVVAPNVSKSNGCDLVCWRHGISLDQTVAIGDAPNDIDVLDRAGFAVAVDAGRHPRVLKHADATCAPPTEGGVADVLQVLGLISSGQ